MDLKEVAKQLRKPEGEMGITIGKNMNEGNAKLYQLVLSKMNLLDNQHLLEIGFGNGKHIPEILSKAKGLSYTGIDFSETMVSQATELNQELINKGSVEIKSGNVSSIPCKSEIFDSVFTLNTLYFWEKPEEDIKELYRVLKKGGEILLGIRPKSIMQNIPFTQYGFRLYEFEDVKSLLEKAGFRDISLTFQDEPPYVLQGIEIKMQGMCITGKK